MGRRHKRSAYSGNERRLYPNAQRPVDDPLIGHLYGTTNHKRAGPITAMCVNSKDERIVPQIDSWHMKSGVALE